MPISFLKTRPDTRLPLSRVGGQGPYFRSLDHLGRSSEAKDCKNPQKSSVTDRQMDGPTKPGVELCSTRQKILMLLPKYISLQIFKMNFYDLFFGLFNLKWKRVIISLWSFNWKKKHAYSFNKFLSRGIWEFLFRIPYQTRQLTFSHRVKTKKNFAQSPRIVLTILPCFS